MRTFLSLQSNQLFELIAKDSNGNHTVRPIRIKESDPTKTPDTSQVVQDGDPRVMTQSGFNTLVPAGSGKYHY